MLLFFSLVTTVLQYYVYFMRENYISELLISFLPYSIGISFFLIIFFAYTTYDHYYKKANFLTIVWSMTTIASLSCTGLYLSEYVHTYHNNPIIQNTDTTSSQSDNLSFLYANIYYKNEEFSGLIHTIEQNNPDIVLLVEYSKIHDEVLSPLLKVNYPYVSRYVGGKGYDGDVIYSKYPLTKIKHTVYPGSFSHVNIEYNNRNINFALIHTSAPVSEHFFAMRNEQLNDLANLMTEYYHNNSGKEIILLGDFNLTPRSVYYTSFNHSMKTIGLDDITTNTTTTQYDALFPSTRCHEQASWICSHIDHVRSNNTTISLEKITIPGSDHDGFLGKI